MRKQKSQCPNGLGIKLQGLLFLVVGLFPLTGAAEYTFTKIADTNSSQFGRISGAPSINKQGTVVFFGCRVDCQRVTGTGIFKGNGGAIVTIAETIGSNILGPINDIPTINDSGNVAFSAILDFGQGPVEGVFVGDGGLLTIIADSSGTPDDPEALRSFNASFINNNDLVAFTAQFKSSAEFGVFAGSGGDLTTIFATTLGGLNAAITINILDDVAFEFNEEIFIGSGGPLISVIDTSGPFRSFETFSLNDLGRLVVSGILDTDIFEIFSVQNGTVTTLVDSSGSFAAFGTVSANNVGGIAFIGQLVTGAQGIFVGPDPVLHKVIATGDPLFGSTVTQIGGEAPLVFFTRGLNDAGQITFRATLADGTEGIYRAEPSNTVGLDIKPQSCPNPLNTKSKGVTPVAVLGVSDFDVTQIDIASLRLENVPAIRSSIEDVATPFTPINGLVDALDCNDFGPDGFDDLTLKFNTQELIQALGDVQDGEVRVLKLTGVLLDDTPIEGQDVVVIKAKGGGNN